MQTLEKQDRDAPGTPRPHAMGVVLAAPSTRDASLADAIEIALFPARVEVLYETANVAPHVQRTHEADAGGTVEDANATPSTVAAALRDSAAALALFDAARRLATRGAAVILLPAGTSDTLVASLAAELPLPVRARKRDDHDTAQRLTLPLTAAPRPFKIGVAGGVGPAATVDFLDKLVTATPAARDQDHLRVVLEQNPHIPDRTAHLLGRSPADPAVALYAACLSLVENGAGLIAIPCNTAHAYAAVLQARLPVPIVSLLDETIDHIVGEFGGRAPGRAVQVGLLATSGTIASGVYRDAAARRGLTLLLPDTPHQDRVMAAIYGERGVKAGFLEGECVVNLLAAASHLARAGAEVLILGCTELPLLLEHDRHFPIGDTHVALVDPTRVLAERCVALAREANEAARLRED
ncbi:amino acid racemase [Robbsia sp. Bb-Pol-6]|uniref:Amino acid racemase n=1 Tax=Robbsia betulipollinis TaxID=2981849 RepID=A0ABT3ZH43_9BURK|nr:amino acid racemase [Robbsia betulipollinis]MCY0385851.1 amino acid racemase [Robbsia betulipollinis]